jgi:UDP-N-acetylglucosamine 2-epimerase
VSRRKVSVVVTARPSYSRIKTALSAIREHPDLELQLVVGASALLERYGTAVRYIEDDGFDIVARVYMVLEGENLAAMAKTTGLGLLELATVFDNLRPDVVVTIADRYETLATAVAASYMNIPVAHVQGGEVTGSIDEKVRHAVTKLSNLHFAFETLHAMRELGLPAFWFWPNVDAGSDGTSNAIRTFREVERPANIHFFKNFAPTDFLRLIYNSLCLVGNSSVGIRECSFLGVPVVNVGSRQTGRDRGRNVIDVGYDRREISRAIGECVATGRFPSDRLYGDGGAGARIADLLATRPLTIEKRLAY